MFTTENTEFTERKEHNGRCDSSVCSVDSVVKSVKRLCHARRTWKTNSELHAPCDIGQEGQKTRAK